MKVLWTQVFQTILVANPLPNVQEEVMEGNQYPLSEKIGDKFVSKGGLQLVC